MRPLPPVRGIYGQSQTTRKVCSAAVETAIEGSAGLKNTPSPEVVKTSLRI